MTKRGRKSVYDEKIKPRFDDIAKWVKRGTTERSIAENLGIAYSTFNKYKVEKTELAELLSDTKKETEIEEEIKKTNWTVYKHTSPSGKVYIGITSRKPEIRWANGKGYGVNTYIRKAIDKYGWDNIDHKILFTGLTEKEAKQKEIELIDQYHSFDPNFGYNLALGGEGQKLSPEQIRQRVLKKRGFGSVMLATSIEDLLLNLDKIEELSKRGATKESIANAFGISRTTLYKWENEEPYIKLALELGRDQSVNDLENAMFESAIGGKQTLKKYAKCKHVEYKDGKRISEKEVMVPYEEEVYFPPNTTAGIYLLKHWGKERGYTNDPLSLDIKKQELELKKEIAENNNW